MDTPDVQADFEKLIADILIQRLHLIELNAENCTEQLGTIHTNFLELQALYANTYMSMVQQAQKANSDMLENMAKSFNALKNNMKQVCDSTTTKTNELLISCLETLKTQCEGALKKNPNLSSRLYQDTMKKIKEIQSTDKTRSTALYNDIVANWDEKYEETVKQLKFPAIKEPVFSIEQRSSITPVASSATATPNANKEPATTCPNVQQASSSNQQQASSSNQQQVSSSNQQQDSSSNQHQTC